MSQEVASCLPWDGGRGGCAHRLLPVRCARRGAEEGSQRRSQNGAYGVPAQEHAGGSGASGGAGQYPVIDVHTHIASVFGRKREADPAAAFKQLDDVVRWNADLNLKTIINLTGGWGDDLKQNVSDLQERYKGHYVNCVTPGYDQTAEPSYPKWQADELARQADRRGRPEDLQDPRPAPAGERQGRAAGQDRRPAFRSHVGSRGRAESAGVHPHRRPRRVLHSPSTASTNAGRSSATIPTGPSTARTTRPRPSCWRRATASSRAIPKPTFVGLHVANHPENLDEVTAWLKKYPNLHVEIGARIGELGRQPRRARKFFDDFQDRIMFGTDATPNGKHSPQQDLKPDHVPGLFPLPRNAGRVFRLRAQPHAAARPLAGSTASGCRTPIAEKGVPQQRGPAARHEDVRF